MPVMIVSYETLRNLTEVLGQTEVGLLLADEGHRLKNADSLTFTALNSIKVHRRVILSGTPIQNDLSEYFALLSFAIPDLLGGRLEFRKNYEIAILKGRDALASDKEKEVGNAKLKELADIVQKFIIRRTNDLLSKYCEYPVPQVSKLQPSDHTSSLQCHTSTSMSYSVRWLLSSWTFIDSLFALPTLSAF